MIDCSTELHNILLFSGRVPPVSASIIEVFLNKISFLSRYIRMGLRTCLPCFEI